MRTRIRWNERGVIPLIGVILAGIFVTAATVTTIVIVRQNHGANPSGFTVAVDSASAARNDAGDPVVTVAYTVDFQSDGAAAALVTPVSVRCTISQKQLTRSRTFTGESQVVGNTRKATGSIVITPGAESRSISGDFNVVCELVRDGAVLDTASGPGFAIAAASEPPQSSTPVSEPPTSSSTELPNVTAFGGRYVAPFNRVAGDETNCALPDNRTVAVEVTSTTTLKIQMDESEIYAGPLTPDLKFTANVGLFPGHPDYYGPLVGQFSGAAPAQLQMTIVTSSPACTLTFATAQG